MKYQRISHSVIDRKPTEHGENLAETARRDAERQRFAVRPGAITQSPFPRSDPQTEQEEST